MTPPALAAAGVAPTARRQRRYNTTVVVRAQQLHEAGWAKADIRRILAHEFSMDPPEWRTVRCWIDPEYAARSYAETARRKRQAKRESDAIPHARQRVFEEADKLNRLLELRGAGLSFDVIAKVLHLDFGEGDRFTAAQIRYSVQTKRYPGRRREPRSL